MIKKTDQTKKGVELMIPGIVIGVIVLIIVIWLISSTMVCNIKKQDRRCISAIDVSLKKRYDLIPNYVETVKGYAKHESETLEKVVAARNQAMTATNIDDKIKQENVLSGALKSLFAVSESYPELKANENFNKLQDQLQRLEEEIAASRRYYNGVVNRYNTKTELFPGNIIAGIFGFKRKPLFEVSNESERENVQVKF